MTFSSQSRNAGQANTSDLRESGGLEFLDLKTSPEVI